MDPIKIHGVVYLTRPDADLSHSDVGDLLFKLLNLRRAVRKHMTTRGDDRCYLDDAELYSALPEGDTRPRAETAVTIENCRRFIRCRQVGQVYTSPQRRIEELEAEVAALKGGN